MRWIGVGVGALVFMAGVGVGLWYLLSPRYAIKQIESAIEAHDYAAFRERVDVERIASRLFDDLWARMKTQRSFESPSQTPSAPSKDKLEEWLYKGLSSAIKPQWIAMIEAETKATIEDRPPPTLESLGLSGLFGGKPFEEVAKARREFFEKLHYEGIAYQKRQGQTAHVGIKLRYAEDSKVLILDVLMQRKGRWSWCIVEAPNLADILLSFIPKEI